MQVRGTRFVGWVVTVILVVGFGGSWLFSHHEQDRAVTQWNEKLSLIADARAREVNNWINTQFRELSALADNASLQIYFATLSEGGARHTRTAGGQADYLRNLLTLTSQRIGFEPEQKTIDQELGANVRKLGSGGLALVSLDGKVLMTTAHMPPLDEAVLEKLRTAPHGASHFWDNADGDQMHPSLMFSVPVYGVQQAKEVAAQTGILVGIRPLQDLYPAIALSPQPAEKTLDVALVRADENGARYLSPLRDGSSLMSQHEAASADSAANEALAHPGHFTQATDYRGMKVLVQARAIPTADWALLVKIDKSEALAATLTTRNSITAAMLLLAVALAVGVVAMWRNASARQQAMLASEYGAQAEMLSVVTDNQLEPLYMVDQDMHLHFANKQAAELMGGPISYIAGKTLGNLIGAGFATQVEPLINSALLDNRVKTLNVTRGMANKMRHLYLRFIPLEHLPVRDLPNPTPGVLIVEQDTTEVIQEREKRLTILNQLVSTLVSLVDKRDPNATEHSTRVAIIARAVAEGMSLPPDTVETTETAARLMNLGKVDVPVELLTRDGKLNDAERDAIRNSLSASAELLKGIAFPGPVSDTLRQAQEHIDGSGPLHLKGDDILVSARIIAAANALVSMASPRSYRRAMECDAALMVLQSEVGQRYDRRVISALAHYLDNQGGRNVLTRATIKAA